MKATAFDSRIRGQKKDMTDTGMTTNSDRMWSRAGVRTGRPHPHARTERPAHHAAGSPATGRVVLLSAAVLLILAAALVVALG